MFSSTEPRPHKLLDQVRDAIRIRHYSYRTEESYDLPPVSATSSLTSWRAIAPPLTTPRKEVGDLAGGDRQCRNCLRLSQNCLANDCDRLSKIEDGYSILMTARLKIEIARAKIENEHTNFKLQDQKSKLWVPL